MSPFNAIPEGCLYSEYGGFEETSIEMIINIYEAFCHFVLSASSRCEFVLVNDDRIENVLTSNDQIIFHPFYN